MHSIVPYLASSSVSQRKITSLLHDELLTASQAYGLIEQGLSIHEVALHIQDGQWWKENAVLSHRKLRLPWKIESWQATLHFQVDGLDFWVDPGPFAPVPDHCPDFILITHAHHDHIARLITLVEHWPEAKVVMTRQTERVLREADTDIVCRVTPRLLVMEYHQSQTVCGATLCCYPAGHFIGAAMFSILFQSDAILISGDIALRDVGGLPGAAIPPGDYGLLALEASSPGRGDLPITDLPRTRGKLLQQIDQQVQAGKTSILINTQSMGQAQEAYASLVMAQRAGAFPGFDVWLHGKAARISALYQNALAKQSPVWSLPILETSKIMVPNSIVITSRMTRDDEDRFLENLPDSVDLLRNPAVYTHGGWAEHVALALLTPCNQILLYHGASLSLMTMLQEAGRELMNIAREE